MRRHSAAVAALALFAALGIGPAAAAAQTTSVPSGATPRSPVACGVAKLVAPDTISTDRAEIRLALSSDGSRMLWGAIDWAGGAGGLDIWERHRGGDGRWLAPAPVSFNSSANDFDPSFAPDGSGAYFFSNRPGGVGGDDLYFAPYDRATGTYGAARNLGAGVNTPHDEWAPTPSPDGALLLFASDGHGGRGKHDLFLARRTGERWGAVEPLGDANGPDDDFDGTFLSDGQSIVFAVGDAEAEHADLYVTERRNGRFGAGRRLGPNVNAPGALNFGPSVSAARPGTLFFTSHREGLTRGRADIYQIQLCNGARR